jgi:hypothetical protein
VPSDRLEQHSGLNAEERCKIRVEHDLLAANDEDGFLDLVGWGKAAPLT